MQTRALESRIAQLRAAVEAGDAEEQFLAQVVRAADARIRDRERAGARLRVVDGSYVGKFVLSRLAEELRRFHNPTTEKTRKLFNDFLEIDVTASWEWQHVYSAKAKKTLDDLIAKRGDAVHRSKAATPGAPPAPHLVKREDLERSIRFLKCLVDATDKALIEK